MDLGNCGFISMDRQFFAGFLSILVIDLILAGDNAVVIAMAVRSLPKEQRKKGILFGAGAAVLLRVGITFFIARLLNVGYVKLLGGMLILWIAVKLFTEAAPREGDERSASSVWQAIKIIALADITMSLDNMLAVGGASGGNLFLLLFGLGLSVPFIIFTSDLLSRLMDKYPIIIYIGAAILGKVGGDMIMTDPVIVDTFHPQRLLVTTAEAVFALGVPVVGRIIVRRTAAREGIDAYRQTGVT